MSYRSFDYTKTSARHQEAIDGQYDREQKLLEEYERGRQRKRAWEESFAEFCERQRRRFTANMQHAEERIREIRDNNSVDKFESRK